VNIYVKKLGSWYIYRREESIGDSMIVDTVMRNERIKGR
jgi:hypothetical protein